MIYANGLIIRMKVKDISQTGRATRGVRVMDLTTGDKVVSVAVISAAETQDNGGGENSQP